VDDVEAEAEMSADVLEEYPLRPDLDDDPPDVRPEVALVARAKPLACGRERLAREARSEDIHASTPASAIEGFDVVPDRSLTQGLIRHPGHESGRSEGFPLDVTHSAIARLGDVQPEVETSDARA
jgi:hypothetical protein